MEKNRYYLLKHDSLLSALLEISDQDYQIRVWANESGPEIGWYLDCVTNFDFDIDVLKSFLRDKVFSLTKEQLKAILRLHVMCLYFNNRILSKEKMPEETVYEREMYIINHPYWKKICKQAQYALSLFRLREDEIRT